MRVFRTAGLCIVALLLLRTNCHADDLERPIRLELSAGALAAGTSVTSGSGDARQTVSVEAGPALGITAGYAVDEHVEVDLSGQYAGHISIPFGSSVDFTSVTAGGRYFVLGRSLAVQPWIGGQAGWYRASIDSSSLFDHSSERTANGAGVNFGAGIDVPIGQLVSLGVGAQYNQTLGTFNDPGFFTALADVAFHLGS